MKTTVILLAGGNGTRMQADVPKQYLHLGNKPIIRHSFDLFLSMPEIHEIVVVCNKEYQNFFSTHQNIKPILFALPGERRQDSVYNGLQVATNDIILVHDSARPFVDSQLVLRALAAGIEFGAATVGMPIKFTIKVSNAQNIVESTPDRTNIWEIQTPQVIHRAILEAGFQHAIHHNISVTDDVSLAELIGKKVKLVEGSHTNIKVTVPSDLTLANQLIHSLES